MGNKSAANQAARRPMASEALKDLGLQPPSPSIPHLLQMIWGFLR